MPKRSTLYDSVARQRAENKIWYRLMLVGYFN